MESGAHVMEIINKQNINGHVTWLKDMALGQEDGSPLASLRARGDALLRIITSASGIPAACQARILKHVYGEIKFLARFQDDQHDPSLLASSNMGYFEMLVQTLLHPSISGVCAVLQSFPAGPIKDLQTKDGNVEVTAHVDVVCMYDGQPAWLIVSDRNPKSLVWSGTDAGHGKCLRSRILLLLSAAAQDAVKAPAFLILCFRRGVENSVAEQLENEFHAFKMENVGKNTGSKHDLFCEIEAGEWVYVESDESDLDKSENCDIKASRDLIDPQDMVMYKVKIPISVDNSVETLQSLVQKCLSLDNAKSNDASYKKEISFIPNDIGQALSCSEVLEVSGIAFCSLMSQVNKRWGQPFQNLGAIKLVNLDTTALIGLVSGISNGSAQVLAQCNNQTLEQRFGSHGHFFKSQAKMELEKPFMPEVKDILKERRPLISEHAWKEFMSIVSVIGGPGEKQRAGTLSKHFRDFIVPNMPSDRVLALPLSSKIHQKHKDVFGTGDRLCAPTLTSNLSFQRAATSKGMAFGIIPHRPLALCGD